MDVLHTRYTLDGEENTTTTWENFQLDGFGTWLWALAQHQNRTARSLPMEWIEAAKITTDYIEGLWQHPCYKGLYGAFIVDPPGGWPAADHEFVMAMNGFDVDFDGANDFYAVNAIPFHYDSHPIPIRVGDKVRIFLVNMLEFDLINSFHLHANFFHYYPTGTSLTPAEYTDTIMQTQAQRGILEFSYKYPGKYMFHAHNTEFAELGWTGHFEVLP